MGGMVPLPPRGVNGTDPPRDDGAEAGSDVQDPGPPRQRARGEDGPGRRFVRDRSSS